MIETSKQHTGLSSLTVELDREHDGRWIAEIPKLPGVTAYGATKQEALRRLYAVALRMLADSALEEGAVLVPVSRLFGYGVAHR
jgi:predicted RNase H-like HicB family nuclease